MSVVTKPSASPPHLRGTGRNPATSTCLTGKHGAKATQRSNSGEAGRS
jgi:hypothetical protein